MMRKGKLLAMLVLGVGLLPVKSWAQFETPDTRSLAQLKVKPLVVTTLDESTAILIKYKHKPAELKAYQEAIGNFNKMFKTAVEKHYNYGKSIEAKGEKEVTQMTLDGNMKYAIIKWDLSSGGFPDPDVMTELYGASTYTDEMRKKSKSLGYSTITVSLIDRSKKLMPVFTVSLPGAYPSEGDMVYAVKLINNELNKLKNEREYKVDEFQTEVEQNNKLLKNRTLLIDKNQLADKTDLEDLKKNYPYKLEITDYATIQNAITGSDTSYAYVQIVPVAVNAASGGTIKSKYRILHLVLDAGDGKVLAKDKPTRLNYQVIADDISKKEIKNYIPK